MSTSLYWKPVPRDVPPPGQLSYDLKKAIAHRMWGHDGSLHGDEIEVGEEHLSYLEGLRDGGVVGADELIDAIRQHGAVLLWISG